MKKIKYEAIYKKVNIDRNITPHICYIKITKNCNLNCYFCSQGKVKSNDNMSLENFKVILEELKNNNIKEIIYTGGEPFMNDNLEQMLRLGKEFKMKQSLVSNFLVDSKKIKRIIKYLNSIGVSLYALETIHDNIVNIPGAFDKIIKNLEIATENNSDLAVNINCTLINENIDIYIIKKLYEFCKNKNYNLNLARLNMVGLSENIDYKEYIIKINNLLKTLNSQNFKINISNCIAPCVLENDIKFLAHGCGAGITFFSIETDGNVKICASSEKVIGNIFINKLNLILNKNLKEYKSLKWLPLYCMNCKNQNFCRGGCHAENNMLQNLTWLDKIVEKTHDSYLDKNINNKLLPTVNSFKKVGLKYILNSSPVRILNYYALKILNEFDGEKTVREILEKYNEDLKVKEYIIALIKDGLVK